MTWHTSHLMKDYVSKIQSILLFVRMLQVKTDFRVHGNQIVGRTNHVLIGSTNCLKNGLTINLLSRSSPWTTSSKWFPLSLRFITPSCNPIHNVSHSIAAQLDIMPSSTFHWIFWAVVRITVLINSISLCIKVKNKETLLTLCYM
jgi:hypothetical protein